MRCQTAPRRSSSRTTTQPAVLSLRRPTLRSRSNSRRQVSSRASPCWITSFSTGAGTSAFWKRGVCSRCFLLTKELACLTGDVGPKRPLFELGLFLRRRNGRGDRRAERDGRVGPKLYNRRRSAA